MSIEYAVVATWTEPEEGASVYGPFDSRAEAEAAIPLVHSDYKESPVDALPSDVEFRVLPMWRVLRDSDGAAFV